MIEDGRLPTKIDIGYDPSDISKEWLEQIINSNIHRRIEGIKINQIDLPTGKVIYAVYVPQSSNAPHQAADKRFYKRFNFESVPMEEYEVRDVSHRSDSPDLELFFEDSITNFDVEIKLTIKNNGSTPAEYILINIYIDARLTQ